MEINLLKITTDNLLMKYFFVMRKPFFAGRQNPGLADYSFAITQSK